MRAFPPTLLHSWSVRLSFGVAQDTLSEVERVKADTTYVSLMSEASPAPLAPDEIIERCLNGDQAAWEAIVRLYWRKVFNVAYKFVGRHDMAEDLTQDVFLKLYRSLDTFDRRANFQTWLIRSEEHTSELQSQSNLVCRLLLEKKKNIKPDK